MKATRQIKQVCLLVNKLFDSLGMSSQPVLSELVADTFSQFEKNWGTRTACAIQKSVYNDFIHYVLELEVQPSSPIWLSRDKDHLPKIYKPLKRALDEGLDERYVLSLLRSYESIRLPVVPDVSTVTVETKGGQNWIIDHEVSFGNFLEKSRWGKFIRKLFKESLSDVQHKNKFGHGLHFTTKMGVLGPAISCAGKEAQSIDDNLMEIINRFSKSFGKVFRPLFDFGFYEIEDFTLSEVIRRNASFYSAEKLPPKCVDPETFSYTGKVACIPDKGGKTRIIAIGNYWVQESLLDLHKVIYKVLRKIPQDGTYRQESAASAVQTQSGKSVVWSYDLTAATDLTPLQPQVQTLKFLDEEIGQGWNKILKTLTFSFKGKPIAYGTGQPMGLYGSWAVFALTHHSIVQYAAFLEKKKYPFKDYRILGDDIAIWDPQVAVRYSDIMQSCLEIKISKQKSITPDLRKPSTDSVSAEFAKRIFKNGKEISPVSPNILIDFQQDYIQLVNLLDWLARRGYIPENGVPACDILSKLLDGLSSHKRIYYVFGTVYLWELLTSRPLLDGISEYIPNIADIQLTKLLDWRLAKLRKQSAQLYQTIMFADEIESGQVTENLGQRPVYGLYFHYVIQQRLNEILDLRDKLSKAAPLSDLEIALRPGTKASDEEDLDTIKRTLQEVEYLPLPTVSDFILGKTEFREKKQLRASYLRSLLDAEKVEDEDIPPPDEPEQTFAFLFK